MGADNHPTVVPSNFEEIEGRSPNQPIDEIEPAEPAGERGLYHLWVAAECQAALEPSFLYIDAPSADDAEMRALLIAAMFGYECTCQIDVRPVEVYV